MKIVFRIEAGEIPQIGTGHLYRCINLAKKLKKNNKIFFALSKLTKKNERNLILKNRFKIISIIKSFSLDREIEKIFSVKPNLIIVDKLNTSKNYILNLKRKCKVVSLDDLGIGSAFTDLTVNSLVKKNSNKNCVWGYKYLILGNKKTKTIKIKNKAKKLFVFFGGCDSRNLTKKITSILGYLNKNTILNIISTRQFPKVDSSQINYFYKPEKFYNIMLNSDMAIVAGGITSFETVRAGIPTICIPQFSHQIRNIYNLSKKKVIITPSKDFKFSKNQLIQTIYNLQNSFSKRKKMSKISKRFIDGKGADRVARLIQKLF